MRRLSGISAVALVLCLSVSSVAMAQQQGRRGRGNFGGGFGGFGGGGLSFLIQNPQVQKELKLSEDQIAKLKEVTDAARQAAGPGGGRRGQNQTDEERQAAREERRKRTEETDKKITDLLTADQNVRLKQVQLWTQGTRALTNNETVAKELALTDDQKSALKTITEETDKKRGELFQGLGRGASDEDRTKAREQFATLQKETDAECLAVLTDDQKSKFTAMKGEKFELDMSAFAGGRGGRGRRGGNNNNN